MSKTCDVTGHIQAWKQSVKSKWCCLRDVMHDSLTMVVTIGCQWEPLSKPDETIQKTKYKLCISSQLIIKIVHTQCSR